MSDDIQDQLQAYCAHTFQARGEVQVSDLTDVTAGWENEVYSFTIEYGAAGERQREDLILRVYPGDNAHVKSAREFHGMSQLHRVGYPVPQVLLLERENSPFGKPFVIMEKIKGQNLWSLLFHSPRGRERKQRLLTLFCELFVQLHTLGWQPFVQNGTHHDMEDPYTFVNRQLSRWRSHLERFPKPDFVPIVEWLEARQDQVPCPKPSPIHWDFHPKNVLLRDDGSAVVIDWTQITVSDARFDLAWTLLLVGSLVNTQWRRSILEEYERLTGSRMAQMAFFDVAACFKRLYGVAVSLSEGAERLGMRSGAEAIMKRQIGAIKQAHDLLLERTGIRVGEIERLFASFST
jgi:aminoglycoside phosphotransferase (APT) family kinase protein